MITNNNRWKTALASVAVLVLWTLICFNTSLFEEGGKFLTSEYILCYAMTTLRHCSIVMHIHDEVVIEADRRMSLEAVCEQMGRTPPWAEGLQLRADGYETDFYKKD